MVLVVNLRGLEEAGLTRSYNLKGYGPSFRPLLPPFCLSGFSSGGSASLYHRANWEEKSLPPVIRGPRISPLGIWVGCVAFSSF